MPPKSKKEKQKETAKIVEDKTFGLKNKNKSKKVQQYVSQVQRQAKHRVEQGTKNAGTGGAGSSAQQAMSKKAMLEARMAELSLVYRPVKEKEKKLSPEELAKKKKEEEEEAERLRILALPVEDQIEEERAKLKTKTPVTLELFNQWKEQKRKLKETAEEKRKKQAYGRGLTKGELKKGGVLTGRELFEYEKEVFVDDEGADADVYERNDDYESEDEEEDSNEVGANKDEEVQPDAADGEDPQPADDDQADGVGDASLFA